MLKIEEKGTTISINQYVISGQYFIGILLVGMYVVGFTYSLVIKHETIWQTVNGLSCTILFFLLGVVILIDHTTSRVIIDRSRSQLIHISSSTLSKKTSIFSFEDIKSIKKDRKTMKGRGFRGRGPRIYSMDYIILLDKDNNKFVLFEEETATPLMDFIFGKPAFTEEVTERIAKEVGVIAEVEDS